MPVVTGKTNPSIAPLVVLHSLYRSYKHKAQHSEELWKDFTEYAAVHTSIGLGKMLLHNGQERVKRELSNAWKILCR